MWAFERLGRVGGEAALRAAMLSATLALQGCAVVAVAGAAVSVTAAVVSTGVKVTGKVIEKTIDAITPDAKPSQ